jgi:transposase
VKIRKFINDPAKLLEEGKRIVSESADNKFVHRVSMVNLILNGLTPQSLSPYCGDSERTLQSWVKSVDENGWESLIAVKQTGRPGKLTNSQVEEIKAAIKEGAEKAGYLVWDGPSLSDYIKKKYGIDYGIRACQILMHKMGFAMIRPQTYPSLENPKKEARDDFKKN